MYVLVATTHTQGQNETDFCDTIEGELVVVPGDCLDPECTCERGCDPSFLGLASGQRTTTTRIVNRPDIDPATHRLLIADGLHRWGLVEHTAGCEDCAWEVEGHLLDLDFLTGPGQLGDVIRRSGCEYSRQQEPSG